ncbi:MAG TPA: helicase-related protein [Pyrinomonadaceae bacterium]|jgi:SNF2 family DNA or RNA helicase
MSQKAMFPNTFLSGIRDNYRRGSVGDFLKDKIKSGSKLSVVSAYFTIYAFAALKEDLRDIERMDFLFGEPRFVRSLDPERTDKKAFKIEDEGLSLENRLTQKRVARECAEWMEDKVNIRSIRQADLLHGKMYHIADGARESAIMGSSNFTVSGLGLGASNNIELNLAVDGNRDREDLKHWFDELWNDDHLVEDVKGEVLLYLAQLYENHAPEFIYYKTLFHIFEQFLAEQGAGGLFDAKDQLVDTQIWNTLFDFQKDGAKGAINKIRVHNGCIIADSVGLGKTFEALAVIKYFELRNDKVLVLCPKKLRENWTVYQAQNNSELNPFLKDRFGYTVLSHTDLSRSRGHAGDIDLETINWGNYDLVVIDESHNFRNNTKGRRDEDGNIIARSRYERLMDDILNSGVKTKVLLLSATPVNNDLKDLRNQIYLLTGDDDAAFSESIGIGSLKDTLATAQRTFTEWANDKTTKERNSSVLLERLGSAFFKLLDELTIARSRRHVQKYYRDTLAVVGEFPRREKPVSHFPDIDTKDEFMSYDKLNDEISNYKLSLFSPSQYVRPEFKKLYADRTEVDNFTQENREHFLIGMMKVNYLKRLESSVKSFAISMERTMEKIVTLEEKIKTFKQARSENRTLDFELVSDVDEEDDELREAMQTGTKLKYKLEHLEVDRWLKDLAKDRQQINLLNISARQVTVERDAKLKELKGLIADKVSRPALDKDGKPKRKILVFTAFADTSAYLYEALVDWARDELGIHAATVTGGAGGNKTTLGGTNFNEILTNFSPVAKKRSAMKGMPQDEEIDLLIATDCISEGQNLQDCDTVVNYDIHWNPVRLIQRFGRIDRIGSRNKSIQLVNFWPTEDLNKYINLRNRVEARMALVDMAATGQDDILSVKEIEELAADELNYRDKQLLRLKDEVLDLEDFNETVALNEFTLDDFRAELARFIESNRKKLQDAPLGLYAVVAARDDIASLSPGVIFCLRQKGDTTGNEAVNPLQPHFLVYVRDDGQVRYTFTQAKQILDIFRALCAEESRANEDLCRLFDEETRDGTDMTRYTELLNKAVLAITHTFRKRNAGNLLSGRGGTLVKRDRQVSATTDFELVTWLVIR